MSKFIEALSVTAKQKPPKSPRLHDDKPKVPYTFYGTLFSLINDEAPAQTIMW